MERDECRMPNCDREPGTADSDVTYRSNRFCSPSCDVRFDDLKADAEQARRDENPEPEVARRDLPEYDGPPY